jgi:hypothetical protein
MSMNPVDRPQAGRMPWPIAAFVIALILAALAFILGPLFR